MTAREVVTAADADALATATAARLLTSLATAQAARGDASVVVTGGGIGIAVLQALTTAPAVGSVDWSRVDVWWGDERFVAPGDDDRNDGQAMAAVGSLFDGARVHRMGSTADFDSPEAAADAYAGELHAVGRPFDVLLLGMGPEGHIASIFPDSPAARDDRMVFAVHDCPKPPPTRVSLGFAAIHDAREVWLVVSGEGKADAIARLLAGATPLELPAAGALGSERSLLLADTAALSRT